MKSYAIKDSQNLIAVLNEHKQLPDIYLGEFLVEAEVITQKELTQALKTQQDQTGKLGQVLIDMGVATQEQVNQALCRKFGIPSVKLENFDIPSHVLTLVPADLALQFNIMPLGEVNGRLIVAMENPLDLRGVEALRFNTNLKIESVMASSHDISLALNKYYSKFDEVEALEDSKVDSIAESDDDGESAHMIEAQAKKKPIVRLLNAIVLQAVIRGASDINIRPGKDRVNVYYRVDGKLEFSRTLHRSLLPALVSRVKIIGHMDIAERRFPQDGHARLLRANKSIDLRISVVPTVNGESVVIRILDKEVGLKPLGELGLSEKDEQRVRSLLAKPHGIFLVTGPTGSGKSTTMYAMLNELKLRNPHILTVEDPVEYNMEDIEQVQITLKKGVTFAETLRHFLRHDPDIIMVGEIRDQETAMIANKAALTGHLVLSTLHTNDAPSTVTRLLDMEIEPYLLSTTLLGVMSQRLVRLNCIHCVEEDIVDEPIRRSLGLGKSDKLYKGAGCNNCNHNGYLGRTLVSEILVVTPTIMELINKGASSHEISEAALSEGMTRLVDNALELAKQGKTSLGEVLAVRID